MDLHRLFTSSATLSTGTGTHRPCGPPSLQRQPPVHRACHVLVEIIGAAVEVQQALAEVALGGVEILSLIHI